MTNDYDSIQRDKCDVCGKTDLGRLCHHNGTPVLQACRTCWPEQFEQQVRAEIDRWLNGESDRVHPSLRTGYGR